METRKLIGFGKSTNSITLPRKWVVKNKLKKGDTVSVRELSMGRLEIIPNTRTQRPKTKSITIPLGDRPIKEVQREFIAAYIKGYSVIHLVGNHDGKVTELRRRLHELIAVEIMEVTSNRITVHVFFDISTISLPKIISRIQNITKTIMEDSAEMLNKGGDMDIKYKELMEKKREVNRQSLFSIRIIVNALQDPVFATRIEADPVRLSFIWHKISYLEKISDYLLNVSFYMSSTDMLKKLGKRGRVALQKLFSDSLRTYEMAISSYNKSSLELANKVFEQHTKNDRALYNYLHKYQNLWIPLITGYMRRASSKCRDIAKITININAA